MSFYAVMHVSMPIDYALLVHQLGKSYPTSYMVVMNLDGTARVRGALPFFHGPVHRDNGRYRFSQQQQHH